MTSLLPARAPVAALRLLLVEDSAGDAELFRTELAAEHDGGIELHWVQTLAGARSALGARPDCVVLDLGLPDANGLEGLRALRGHSPAVPIVVLTGRDDGEFGLAAVGAGAQDYVIKGTVPASGVVRAARFAIERQRAHGLLERRAFEDPLTGLGNRAMLLDRLSLALSRRRRHRAPVGVLFIDLDGFKAVNDGYGHAAGDRLLVEVAAVLRGALRAEDTLARFGGDEFAALCEELPDAVACARVAERVLGAVSHLDGPGRSVSLSLGIALSGATEDPEALLARADAAMYAAKRSGKSAWRLAEPAAPLREALA